MKLKFIDVNKAPKRPKATIHLTGKLGLNSDAAEVMGLDDGRLSFRVAINEDEPSRENLYLLPCADGERDEMCVTAAKAGDYYYLNLKNVFDRMGLKYKEYKIIYDIIVDEYEGQKLFVLNRREKLIKRS